MKKYLLLASTILIVACAPSKNKLAMMNNYDLCDMVYKLQNSAETWNTKYYWEELQSRRASCEPYAAQIRQQNNAQQAQMLNFFGAMGVATGIAASGQNSAPVINNSNSAQQRPLPPVNIPLPNTIPSR